MATKTIQFAVVIQVVPKVRLDYHRATKGSREYLGGPPLEPDEPAYVDVSDTAYIKTPARYSPKQVTRLEEEIEEEIMGGEL